MKPEYLEVLRNLRHEGHAVIIWTPEELGDASPRRVEDRLIELGHEVIDCLKTAEDTDNDGEHTEDHDAGETPETRGRGPSAGA